MRSVKVVFEYKIEELQKYQSKYAHRFSEVSMEELIIIGDHVSDVLRRTPETICRVLECLEDTLRDGDCCVRIEDGGDGE